MNKKNFIVPYDFTAVADTALNHAIVVAKTADANIYLLHVVSNDTKVAGSLEKLQGVIENLNTSVEITPVVRIGNIFDDIGKVAAEYFSQLIFMGTHGAKGWQHVVGSNALRVITNSNVPFVIVQEKGIKPGGYENIVTPLDLSKSTKQKLVYIAEIAEYFQSKIHIVTMKETDEGLAQKLKENIIIAQKFLNERNIEFTTTILDSVGFDKEIVKHAVRVDADLIAIMNLNQPNLFGMLTGNYEQYIITNDAMVPTLIVNPLSNDDKFRESGGSSYSFVQPW